MQTKLKGFWEKIKSFFAKLNKKVRILLGVCAGVILVLVIAAVLLLNRTEYELLQGGLNASEISNVAQFLGNNGVTDYQIQGDKVLVPKGRAQGLQGQLALSGNLNSGFLYEYLDSHSGGSSQEQERAWLIAQTQKLEAIIRTFEGVQEASVTISPGTERIYVLDPVATPATAPVTITPTTSKPLSSGVVEAIRNLVSYSISGLEISNVTIGDTLGNTYSQNNTTDSISEASALKVQYQEQISNQVRSQVLQVLEPIYGPGNITVSVSTVVDVNRKVIDKTTYEQPPGTAPTGCS